MFILLPKKYGIGNLCFEEGVLVHSMIWIWNDSKGLDPSYKMDLDFWNCFGRKKKMSYNRRNTTQIFQPMAKEGIFVASCFLFLATKPFQKGVYSQRKECAL